MPRKGSKTNKAQLSDTLATVIKDFNSAWEYTQGAWHKRWEDNQFLYNGDRVKRGYIGITDTFVPMSFSTVETLTSGLFGSKPKFDFMPPENKPDQKTDILNGLLDFYWDKDQWSLKIINTGRNMFKLGTAVDYFYWEGDHPCLINVPIRDFFIDPTASSLDTARFCGRRYLTTVEELKTFEIVDLDAEPDEDGNYPMKKKYSNLDDVNIESGSTGDNTDKQEKDMWYGSTVTDAPKKQVEVIEYWTLEKTVSILNRNAVIEDSENYYLAKDRANGTVYPEGLMPFADARDYVDESLYYAKGEIDIISDQQELLNDITNQNIDSITFTLNQMYTLDPKYANLLSEIENLPGAVYPVEAGALNPIEQRAVPPDAFLERQNIKNEIRETTASNEIVKGAPDSSSGATTATEINAQIAGAGQRFNLKVTQIENGYFYRMSKIIFRMIQLYVTEPMMVRIVGKDGARWEEFDPNAFDGVYEPRVQLEATINNEKQNQAADAKEMLGAFLGDPDINQQELKKLVLQRSFNLDPDEVESLIADQGNMMGEELGMAGELPPELMEGMAQDPAMAGLPPELAGLPPEMATPPVDLIQQQKLDQAQEKHEVEMALKLADLQAKQAKSQGVMV
jgi:hypothetical protein